MANLCAKAESGSCAGCNILGLVTLRVEKGQNVQKAADIIRPVYCPEGILPQTELIVNSRLDKGQGDTSATLYTRT